VPTRLHPSQAIALIDDTVTALATEQLKLLLETKHLYQRVSIDPTERIAALCADFVYTDQPARVPKYLAELATATLTLGAEKAIPIHRDGSLGEGTSSPAIGFANVKMHCSACKGREAFAPTWMRDIDHETENTGRWRTAPNRIPQQGEPVQQHFCVAYLCQHCSSEMVIVIVARKGWYLSLEGRSPIEGVSVPKYIPKKERVLFAEVMVARNVGKPLAAIFFLRIVIEQFARRQAGLTDSMAMGDQIMDDYAGTLPLQYREVMPSLKVWYSKLSGAIHAARADEELLREAMDEIERHFKVRDAFSIPDAPKAAGAK
jgi:hypothetical protein